MSGGIGLQIACNCVKRERQHNLLFMWPNGQQHIGMSTGKNQSYSFPSVAKPEENHVSACLSMPFQFFYLSCIASFLRVWATSLAAFTMLAHQEIIWGQISGHCSILQYK